MHAPTEQACVAHSDAPASRPRSTSAEDAQGSGRQELDSGPQGPILERRVRASQPRSPEPRHRLGEALWRSAQSLLWAVSQSLFISRSPYNRTLANGACPGLHTSINASKTTATSYGSQLGKRTKSSKHTEQP